MTAPDADETPAASSLALPAKLPSFQDLALLRRALTHRSYLNEHAEALEDNERLEFLGDAVLDFIIGAYLYCRYPEMQEGRLTRLRAALVRTEQLAAFAEALNLGPLVRLGKGEESGRQRPALLCAAFEAVTGAYFLDSGVEAVRIFVEPLFGPAAERILRAEADHDAKSLLQEWAQAKRGQTPRYYTVSATGPDHQKIFTVEVRIGDEVYGAGTGPNKQVAAQGAAQAGLKKAGQT
jgi:ribonuclease-3